MSQDGAVFTARHGPGFFSSARRLRLPPGGHVEPGRVLGYHVDLRAKAPVGGELAAADLPRGRGHVAVAQAALGYHERFVAGEGGEHLERALRLGRHLLAVQLREPGPRFGGLAHDFAYRHGAPLAPGWLSAMAQGQAASLFVRLALATGHDRFAAAAADALAPFGVPVADGGVGGTLAGRSFPQEYPTTPQSHVLNGGIFALWGLHDVAAGLDRPEAAARFEEGVEALASSLGAWDLGYWSRYDLFPHPVLVNVASSFYHVLHVDQLVALGRLTDDARLAEAAARFARQYAVRANRALAFVHKAAFRLLVPRHPVV